MSDFFNQTIANLYSQAEASMNGNLAIAEIRNDLAVPETIPEENSSIMNETEIEFLESGGNTDVILSRYIQLLNIAHQCPYTGGPAVERARAFIAMINDSMEYNDDATCLQVGVFRSEVVNDPKPTENSLSHVELIPNPASGQFEIRLKLNQEDICHVIVRNSSEQLIYNNRFQCNVKSFKIISSNWTPGVYIVSITIDHSFTEIKKLIIVK